jgi:hypothetical protein
MEYFNNVLLETYREYYSNNPYYTNFREGFLLHLWHDFFKKPIDTLEILWRDILKVIRNYYFSCEWNEVYDFVEFVAKQNNYFKNRGFREKCNLILERELSAYRFVGDIITPLTSDEEIEEVELALSNTDKFRSINIHLRAAVDFLSDRKSPDYRNSIKESISAVEAFCKIVTESPKTLGQCIKSLEKRINFHPALKEAFDKLYGWTSDAEGIRHGLGLMEEPNLEFEDAKFMLVACSAFINFLLEKAAKAGINF